MTDASRTRRRRFTRLFLSPKARRRARAGEVDPASVSGANTNGRITGDDVLEFVAQSPHPLARNAASEPAPQAPELPPDPAETITGPPRVTTTAPSPTATAYSPPPAPPPTIDEPTVFEPVVVEPVVVEPVAVEPAADDIVPLSRVRQITGDHMVRSKATAPHALTVVEVDFVRVEQVRRSAGLTYLPFVARATVDAIAQFPHLNSSVGDRQLLAHRDVNLGIAVDLDHQGLVVPVVRNADGKRLTAIAAEVVDLAQRARAKRLSPDDLVGGTFTITNPGPYGTMLSVPIINQPQVAILATDGVKRRPVVVELEDGDEAIGIHPVGLLALSWDHRAFDGAYASAFLALVRKILETRDWQAEL